MYQIEEDLLSNTKLRSPPPPPPPRMPFLSLHCHHQSINQIWLSIVACYTSHNSNNIGDSLSKCCPLLAVLFIKLTIVLCSIWWPIWWQQADQLPDDGSVVWRLQMQWIYSHDLRLQFWQSVSHLVRQPFFFCLPNFKKENKQNKFNKKSHFTSLCGRPAAEKMGIFWPLAMLFMPSMAEIPVCIISSG